MRQGQLRVTWGAVLLYEDENVDMNSRTAFRRLKDVLCHSLPLDQISLPYLVFKSWPLKTFEWPILR